MTILLLFLPKNAKRHQKEIEFDKYCDLSAIYSLIFEWFLSWFLSFFVILYSNISRYKNLEASSTLWIDFLLRLNKKNFFPFFHSFENQWWNFFWRFCLDTTLGYAWKDVIHGKAWRYYDNNLQVPEIFRVNTLDVHFQYRPQMFFNIFQYFSWIFLISCASTLTSSRHPTLRWVLNIKWKFSFLFSLFLLLHIFKSIVPLSQSLLRNLILYSFEEEEYSTPFIDI